MSIFTFSIPICVTFHIYIHICTYMVHIFHICACSYFASCSAYCTQSSPPPSFVLGVTYEILNFKIMSSCCVGLNFICLLISLTYTPTYVQTWNKLGYKHYIYMYMCKRIYYIQMCSYTYVLAKLYNEATKSYMNVCWVEIKKKQQLTANQQNYVAYFCAFLI